MVFGFVSAKVFYVLVSQGEARVSQGVSPLAACSCAQMVVVYMRGADHVHALDGI